MSSKNDSSGRYGHGERLERPAIVLPIPSDRTIILTGFTAPRTDSKNEDPIRIRCKREPGFIPSGFFCKVVRTMQKSTRPTEDAFTRKLDVAGTEYEFVQSNGPVTIVAKRLDRSKAVAMKVTISTSERPESIRREFSSIVVDEIYAFITVMSGVMVHYNVEPADGDNLDEDEREWLNLGQDDDEPEVDSVSVDSAPVAVAET